MSVNTHNIVPTKKEITELIDLSTGNNKSDHHEGEVGTSPEALRRIGAVLNLGDLAVGAVGGVVKDPGQKLPGRVEVYNALNNGEYGTIQGASGSPAREIGHVGLGVTVAPPHSGGEL